MLAFIEFLTIPPLNVAVLAPPTVDALLSLVITARVEKTPSAADEALTNIRSTGLCVKFKEEGVSPVTETVSPTLKAQPVPVSYTHLRAHET